MTDEESRPMDVGLLASLAGAGALLGTLSAFGVLAGSLELVAWIVLSTGALIAGMRRVPHDAFRHLAFGMMLAGFLAGDAKVLLWDRFLANHQAMADAAMAEGAAEIPRTAVIISDTVTGILFGLITGGIAAYMLKRRG